MCDLLDYLHQMEIMSERPWKDLTDEFRRINEDSVSRIDLPAWVDNTVDSISPLFTNLLGRLQCV